MGKDDQYCTELSVFWIVLLVLCEATGPYAHADNDLCNFFTATCFLLPLLEVFRSRL